MGDVPWYGVIFIVLTWFSVFVVMLIIAWEHTRETEQRWKKGKDRKREEGKI